MHDDHDNDHDHDNPWADRINEAYYDAMGTAFGQKTRERINWMCKQARGATVLDIGCSQGIASILMAREGMAVTGLDIYPPAIEYALAERAKEIASVQQRLDFRCVELAAIGDEQFDTVVMGEVVEHQTNPVRFIRQGAARVAPGGRVIITVPYGLHPWPDHKSTIFPRDLYSALADDFALETIEVTDGYIRVVAGRRRSGDAVEDDMQLLLRVTETGAVDAQESYYSANAAGQECVKAKGSLENIIKSMRDEQGKLAARASGIERDLAVTTERASGLQSALELARQAVVDRSIEYVEALRAQRDDHAVRVRAQEALAESHARRTEELLRQVAGLQVEIAEVRAAEHIAVSRAGELGAQCESHAGRVDELLQKHADLQLELADVRAAERTATSRAEALQVQCESQVLRIDEMLQQHVELQAELADARAAEHAATSRAEELHNADRIRLSELQEALDSARTRANDLQVLADELKARQGKLIADLKEAQEKRSGHWAKLVAEETRSKRLVSLAQTLHEDNQRYEHSIALAIGRAMLGLGSMRGAIGFPRALVRVVRLYQRRRSGTIPEKPLVLPSLPKIKISGKPATGTGSIRAQGVEEVSGLRNGEQQKLAVLGWEQESSRGSIPVMSVLDEFSRACFAPHAKLIEPRPDNWEGLLEAYSPRLLLVESSWKGNHGSWQYRVADYANPPGRELVEMVAGFRARNIPTVFWNKEDPVHFANFIESASVFDVVLTTASEVVPRYQGRTSARVGVLQFAAEETLHNPIGSAERNEKVCFAGSFYANRFQERRDDQLMLLDAASGFDFDIFDRNHEPNSSKGSDFAFPDRLRRFVRGRLPYEAIGRTYREYRVFLNVNSVIDSPTMFSRRVFELLACGTPVVSTWSRGTEETFGNDLVWHVRSREEAEDAIQTLMTNDREWHRRSLAGIRAVLSEHTYRHRFDQICQLLGMDLHEGDHFGEVVVAAEVATTAEAASVIGSFTRQILAPGIRKRLLLVSPTRIDLPSVDAQLDLVACNDVRLAEAIVKARKPNQARMLAIISPFAVYGRHYLQDLLHAARYSGAAIIGKSESGSKSGQYMRDVALDKLAIVINEEKLSEKSIHGVLRDDFLTTLNNRVSTYSTDFANFARTDGLAEHEQIDDLLREIEL